MEGVVGVLRSQPGRPGMTLRSNVQKNSTYTFKGVNWPPGLVARIYFASFDDLGVVKCENLLFWGCLGIFGGMAIQKSVETPNGHFNSAGKPPADHK